MKHFIAVILSLIASQTALLAQNETTDDSTSAVSDSFEVSLLTCAPGKVAYTMYGHTAIRVHNLSSGTDVAFNYGMFDYDEDNFLFKFVKGETDYVLGAESTQHFFNRYGEKGVGVEEQILNLTQGECRRIFLLLCENAQPENRTYRYNWLYDNCTTRARDMIERSIDGEVVYLRPDAHLTARQILHVFSKANRWIEFGENLILGYELDTALTKRQQMFIPSYYAADADSALIVRADGQSVPLVKSKGMAVVGTSGTKTGSSLDGPFTAFAALMIATIIIIVFEVRRKRTFKWFDVALQALEGLAGLLIFFLTFFSEHPGTDTNMIILLLNPLSFVWIPFFAMRKTRKVCIVILAEFALFIITLALLPQCYDMAVWPLVLTLLLRLTVNIFLSREYSLTLQSETKQNKQKR